MYIDVVYFFIFLNNECVFIMSDCALRFILCKNGLSVKSPVDFTPGKFCFLRFYIFFSWAGGNRGPRGNRHLLLLKGSL